MTVQQSPDAPGWWWTDSMGSEPYALHVLDSGVGLVAEIGDDHVPVEDVRGWRGRVAPPGDLEQARADAACAALNDIHESLRVALSTAHASAAQHVRALASAGRRQVATKARPFLDEFDVARFPSDIDLVERAVMGTRCRPGIKARWCHIHDAFGLGSGFSAALCRAFGLDPDEEVGVDIYDHFEIDR